MNKKVIVFERIVPLIASNFSIPIFEYTKIFRINGFKDNNMQMYITESLCFIFIIFFKIKRARYTSNIAKIEKYCLKSYVRILRRFLMYFMSVNFILPPLRKINEDTN